MRGEIVKYVIRRELLKNRFFFFLHALKCLAFIMHVLYKANKLNAIKIE